MGELNFRLAVPEDKAAALKIYSEASGRLHQFGVDQWQNNYPNEQTFMQDIAFGELYAAEEDGKVCAVVTISLRPEPTYREIDGEWNSDDSYAVVHRIAVAGEHCRNGIAGRVMEFAYKTAAAKGAKYMRIDTHKDNLPMRALLKGQGFKLCGVIWLENGDERIAFDRAL